MASVALRGLAALALALAVTASPLSTKYVGSSTSAASSGLGLLVIGDWGGQGSSPYTEPGELACAQGMAVVAKQINAQAVLALGDNFYDNGIHGDATNFRFNVTFESVYADPALQIPFYVVAGNHDHLGNVSAEIAYTQYSRRWRFPDYYYKQSFNFPSTNPEDADGLTTVDFIMIDTVLLAGNSDLFEEGPAHQGLADSQWDYIEKQLAASTADYLWVAGHYPVYSGCEHGNTQILVDRLRPLLEKYKATGYACGHDHCLEDIDDGSGVHYMLSGAADNCCYSNSNASKLPKNSLKFKMWNEGHGSPIIGGFASMRFTSQSMVATYHAANGTLLYTTPPMLPRTH